MTHPEGTIVVESTVVSSEEQKTRKFNKDKLVLRTLYVTTATLVTVAIVQAVKEHRENKEN